MASIICKMCGGLLVLPEGVTFGECPCCGSRTTFPAIADAMTESLYSDAEHFRQSKAFEKASATFSSILARNSEDPDAYWGRLLSRFGIVYAEDPASHTRIPVRHLVRAESILSDPDYQNALKFATDSNRAYYESEANRIDATRPAVAPVNTVKAVKPLRPLPDLKPVQPQPVADADPVAAGGGAGAPDSDKIMRRCSILMEQHDWATAREHCQRGLDSDPENPDLYLMLCMINHQIPNQSELGNCQSDLSLDRNFQTALKLYPPDRREQLLKIQQNAQFNFHLSKCLSGKGVPNTSQLAWSNAPLSEDPDFQSALRSAPPNRREELLSLQNGQMDNLLSQIKTKYGVSEVFQAPIPLESESFFQMAQKCAPPERQQELRDIQRKQSDYFLNLCMSAHNVFDESGLGLCEMPLADDRNFQMALRSAPPERRAELQMISHGQADSFLWKCLSSRNLEKETDLANCTTPLANDQNFQMALKYSAPERREYLKQIQAAQSDMFLRKCMKRFGFSDPSRLHKCRGNLMKDSDFKAALKCASPEQAKRLRWILVRHGVQRVKRGVKRLLSWALFLAILGAIGSSWFLFPEIGAVLDIPEKQYEVAENYRTGLYFYDFIYTREKDEKKAVEWYRKAAEQGLPRAQIRLAICYATRTGVDVDMSREAKTWFDKGIGGLKDSAKDDNAEDQCLLGFCYLNGFGVDYDSTEGLKWLRRAAKQDYPLAQYLYGSELGGKDAVSWYRKAAKKGFAPAQYALARCYGGGISGVKKNEEKAVEWLRKSAKQGYDYAQMALAEAYADGFGELDSDDEMAFKWYLRAAKKGNKYAQYEVGKRYEEGDGVKESEKEALKWYRKSSEQEFEPAKRALERLEDEVDD